MDVVRNAPDNGRWMVFAFLLIGVFGYLMRVTNWFSDVPGDLGDARFNTVILEHVSNWLFRHKGDLWSPAFFYPYSGALAFSENYLGSAWIYGLARLIGASREIAFDIWFCAGSLAGFFACVYACRRLNFRWFSAAVAGFVFAFSLPVLAQEGHAQLIYRFGIPLGVMEVLLFTSTKETMHFARALSWLAIQFLCSIYLGVFLSFLLIVTGGISSFRWSPEGKPPKHPITVSNYSRMLSCLIAFVLCLAVAYMLARYHFIAQAYGLSREHSGLLSMLPRVQSYFLADRSQLTRWIGDWVSDVPMRHEHQMFFGLGVLVLCILAVVKKRSNYYVKIFGITTLLLFSITLSVSGYSLYNLIAKVPGLGAIVAISRISLVMLFPISLLAALGAEAAADLLRSKAFPVALAVIGLLSLEVVTYEPAHVSVSSWRARITDLRSNWHPNADVSNKVLYVLDKEGEAPLYRELDAMILSQDLGIPTINGYSGNVPPTYRSPDGCASGLVRVTGYVARNKLPISYLTDLAKRTIVLPSDSCPFFSRLSPTYGPLPDHLFKSISLKISALGKIDKNYVIDVEIENKAAIPLPAVSGDDKPVQFSWQFMPKGENVNAAGWSTRALLQEDIQPGTIHKQRLILQPPSVPGEYTLAVTLVQDNVAWFQDRGMTVARLDAKSTITVR